ncbi:MAG: hypothetical protein AAFQ61_07440 [Cyanobacteria bacterium J06626_23]
MLIAKIFIQLMLALVCAGIANIILPRQMPGKSIGALLVGFAGVLLGEWLVNLLQRTLGIDLGVLAWEFQGIPILPAILISTLVLYLFTLLFGEQRYGGPR